MFALLLALLVLAPLPSVAQADMPTRLLIPSIGVDAPVVTLGVRDDGTMDSPDGPDPVAWYTFSPTPGNPGNAVFAGHRDWHTGVVGVFWRLGDVSVGDSIAVVLADGRTIEYTVKESRQIVESEVPIDQIVGQTADEIITLITCEGSFDAESHDYDRRRIVWAARQVS